MEHQEFHPIAREAATLMVMEGEKVTISKQGRARLERSLAALFRSRDLSWAVRSLLGMACHAQAGGHGDVAEILIRVASTARHALSAIDPPAAAQVDATLRAFERFSGGPRKRAPAFGASAPGGTVGLDAIMPRRRI